MKIAAVQLHIDHLERASNWDRAESFMAKAAEQQVDLIVFPEYVILITLFYLNDAYNAGFLSVVPVESLPLSAAVRGSQSWRNAMAWIS